MASNSRFVSNIKIWVFIIPILMITVIPFFNYEWIYTISETEVESNIRIFGTEVHRNIEASSDDEFTRWFISPGYYKNSTTNIRPAGNVQFGKFEASFASKYFSNFWKMIYRAIYRFNVAWQWLAGAFFLILACMYDGWQQRNIKKHTFGYSNPLAFHLITHSFFVVTGLAIALCFFPTAISVNFWVIGIVLVSGLGWKMMESFQTAQ